MIDHFDEKRGMVAKLLAMLKEHASNEVNSGLKKPEGMPEDAHGIAVERVEAIPAHEMDEPTPEHDVVTKLAKGGYADAPEKKIPYESADGHPDEEGAAHKAVLEPLESREAETTEEHEEPLSAEYPEAESEQPSMFASFLNRKKKK